MKLLSKAEIEKLLEGTKKGRWFIRHGKRSANLRRIWALCQAGYESYVAETRSGNDAALIAAAPDLAHTALELWERFTAQTMAHGETLKKYDSKVAELEMNIPLIKALGDRGLALEAKLAGLRERVEKRKLTVIRSGGGTDFGRGFEEGFQAAKDAVLGMIDEI